MQKNSAGRWLALTLCAGLVGQASGEEQTQLTALVKIDDFTVTNMHYVLFATQTGRRPQDGKGQLELLNELTTNFMIANSALGKELSGRPEVAASLEVARARLLAQTFVRDQMGQAKIDEAELRKRFDDQYADAPKKMEFKARHILLKTEDEAKAVIGDLDGGADFATLAKERSIGPSKSVGGDLGWFGPDQMVSEFSSATQALSNAAYSKSPVQTQFGWHVILREDSRELPAPTFESKRQELEDQVRREHVSAAIADIKAKTEIEVQDALAEK